MSEQNDILATVREAQRRGLLQNLSDADRAILLDKIGGPQEAERLGVLSLTQKQVEQAAQAQAPITQQSEPPLTIGQQITSPITTSIDRPDAAAANISNAVTETFNPLPLIQMVNPLRGKVDIDTDLETFQSIFNFPVIRGAELAARLFVPDDEQPPLTTFAQVVQDQKNLNDELTSINPGVREGVETGLVVGSLAQLGNSAIKGATKLAKSEGARKIASKAQAFRAKRAETKARRLAADVLSETDSPMLDAIMKRPENVRKILDKGADVTPNDLAIEVKGSLESITSELGQRVGKFRNAAFADTKTRMQVPEEIAQNLKVIKQRTVLDGQSVLPPKMAAQIQRAEKIAEAGVATPNQQMIMIDLLDDVIDYGSKNQINSIKSIAPNLGGIRRGLKNNIRQAHPEWAKADDMYSGFMENAQGLVNKLNSDGAESFVANLLNKNKNPVRNRLEGALNYMEALDPTARGYGNLFLSRLSDIKGAQGIKNLQNLNRVKQEKVFSTLRKYEAAGAAAGGAIGSLFGNAFAGAIAGGKVGNILGKAATNPVRILKIAAKSNRLSKNARTLAKDMGQMVELLGPEASIAFLDTLGPIPAVNELIKFTQSENKQQKEQK